MTALESTAEVRATLGQISKFITKGATPTTYGFQWESSGVRFLRSECVSEHGLDLRQSMYISEAANQVLQRSQVSDGDLLLTITGNVGRVVRVRGLGRANINQHIARVRVRDSRFDAGYVYHFLSQRSMRQHYEKIVTGLAYPQISLRQVRETEVIGPATDVQQRIAAALDESDDLIATLERLIAKKRALKQGVMQQLLTGETRLPGFHDPWAETTLGVLGTFLKGRGVKRDDVFRAGIPCIRYGELYTAFNDYTTVTRSFVEPSVAATALEIRSGDLLFAGSGETRAEIGKCVAYIGNTPAVAGGDIIVLRGSEFNPVYLAVLANTSPVLNQKARAGQGDAVVHISSRALAEVRVILPKRPEQDAIAAVLMDADMEIRAMRKRLAKARSIKRGMTQELLTGGSRLGIPEEAA